MFIFFCEFAFALLFFVFLAECLVDGEMQYYNERVDEYEKYDEDREVSANEEAENQLNYALLFGLVVLV